VIIETAETAKAAKARGAFYTPIELTRFLARWAIRSPSDRTLEPSCGDGAFVTAAAARYSDLGVDDLGDRLVGIEREASEAVKARAIAPTARVFAADFFDVEPADMPVVDAVIGNPPYIRYHDFAGTDRDKGLARARQMGVSLTRLASSWAPFVVHATAFLRENGRLGLVLPAELLHTDYGQPVRELLLRRFGSVVIVAFDRAVFGAQVDAVLLLASSDDAMGLRVLRVPDERALDTLEVVDHGRLTPLTPAARWSRNLDGEAGAIYTAIESGGDATPLGAVASVDIGFVSGANDFFVMTRDEAKSRGLPDEVLTAAIRRPRDIPGLLVSQGDVSVLLDLAGRPAPTDEPLVAYLREGEESGISQRYKCRVRRPWYAVPLPRRKPDAFLPYMSHHGPRLIVNDVGAWSSNLVHGVALGPLAPPARALAVAMASSLTLLSAEIEGRAYGGGVLKLETKEAERLLVPAMSVDDRARLPEMLTAVDAALRHGDTEAAAVLVDQALGLDHEKLWQAYLGFRGRRLGLRSRRPGDRPAPA
jgi:adenine-specific DNA methylase